MLTSTIVPSESAKGTFEENARVAVCLCIRLGTVERIGFRHARQQLGKQGDAASLIPPDDNDYLCQLITRQKGQQKPVDLDGGTFNYANIWM